MEKKRKSYEKNNKWELVILNLFQNPYTVTMGYTYILASKKNGTLYVGVTNNLYRRISEHKSGTHEGFTKKHDIKMLVYYEKYNSIIDAIAREKQIKNWRRQWKINLIQEFNPEWKDYSGELM